MVGNRGAKFLSVTTLPAIQELQLCPLQEFKGASVPVPEKRVMKFIFAVPVTVSIFEQVMIAKEMVEWDGLRRGHPKAIDGLRYVAIPVISFLGYNWFLASRN